VHWRSACVRRATDVQEALATTHSLVDRKFSGKTVMVKLTPDELKRLDPYTLLALLGKKVIRPRGRGSSETIFRITDFQAGRNVNRMNCTRLLVMKTSGPCLFQHLMGTYIPGRNNLAYQPSYCHQDCSGTIRVAGRY
jgi:hypothetical protein